MLASILGITVCSFVFVVCVKIFLSLSSNLFRTLSIGISKVVFFLNTLVLGLSGGMIVYSIFFKEKGYAWPFIIALIIMIAVYSIGNNAKKVALWSSVHFLFACTDGYVIGRFITDVLSSKGTPTSVTLKIYIYGLCIFALLFVFHIERKAKLRCEE